MLFREKLKALRERAGMSQPGLAAAAGVPVGTIRTLEQGRRLPNWQTLLRLAAALGAKLGDFAGCDPDEKPLPRAGSSSTAKRPRKR